MLSVNVKTAKGRRSSSTRWLQRQLNDPYVAEAHRCGYRSRAAFKLIELDDRFHIFDNGYQIVDLGAAPGGWCQVAAERCNALGNDGKIGRVIGLDLKEIESIPGAEFLQGDFFEREVIKQLLSIMQGPVDVVLSDMAAAASGHAATDHIRVIDLLEASIDFANQVLKPGGTFVGKVLKGGTENNLLARLKRDFKFVRHAKPPASRSDSAESYVIAQSFRNPIATNTGSK